MKFRLKDIYGLFYVMTEGIESDGSNRWATLFGIFSLFLDVAQVIHVMVSTQLGWSPASAQLAQWCDLMFIFKSQAQRVIPQWVFYSVGMLLVSVAMADAIYVVKLFSSGHVDQLWPVKLLSFLVAAIVTTAFSSIFNWLLHPIECLAYPQAVIFSTYINGPGAQCTPFNYPDIMITIPTLIFTVLFMLFALTTSLLTFSLNPLSTQIRSQCNGRVENLWLSFEMAVSISVYVANFTTYLAANLVLLLWIIFVMYNHLSIFPFHSHLVNVLRGGIFMMTAWLLCMSCIFSLIQVVVKTRPTDLPIDSISQFLQWVALACMPFAFLVGGAMVHYGRERLYATLDALHHEVEQHKMLLDSGGVMCADVGKQHAPRTDVLHLENIMPDITAVKQPVRSEWIKFFKSNLEKHKTFASSMHANSCARALLYRRDEKNLKFLNLVVRRGLEEHPYSMGLYMLQIKLLRFVHRSPMNASMQEKMIQAGCKKLGITDGYILYALMRKASQEKAGTSIGQDDLKAIDLMEYDAGMKKGEKLQMRCIGAMKSFWRVAARRQFKPHNVASMLASLREWDEAISMAQKEYVWLLKKYKNSPTLLMSYARFCDFILNDEKLASLKREAAHRAAKSEAAITGDFEGTNSQGGDFVEEKERSVREGSVASEAESRRTMASRYIQNITPLILGREIAVMRRLHLQIKVLVFILLMLGTIAFVFVAYFIFNDIAVQDISGITVTAQFRVMAVMCAYLQRSQMIAATLWDQDRVDLLAQQTLNITTAIENANWNMYHNIDTSEIRDHMHNTMYEAQVPMSPAFRARNSTYFNLVNEFTRRVSQAALLPIEELRDPNNDLRTISDGKNNVVYTQENLFRIYVPMFEGIVDKYEREVAKFGIVAMQLVGTICAIIALNVAIMAVCVIRALSNHIQTLQHKFVCCCVALTLPLGAAQTIFKHFRTLENQIKDGDADDDQEAKLEDVNNMLENQGDQSPGVISAEQEHQALMDQNTRHNSGLLSESARFARMSDEGDDSKESLLQRVESMGSGAEARGVFGQLAQGSFKLSPQKMRGASPEEPRGQPLPLSNGVLGKLTEKNLQTHITQSGGYNETEGGITLLNHKKAGADSGSMSSNHSVPKSPLSSIGTSSPITTPTLNRTPSADDFNRSMSSLGRVKSSGSLSNARKDPALLSPKFTPGKAEVSATVVNLDDSEASASKGMQAWKNSRVKLHAAAAFQKRHLKSAMKASPILKHTNKKATPESSPSKRQVLIMGKDGNVTPSRFKARESGEGWIEYNSSGDRGSDFDRPASGGSGGGGGGSDGERRTRGHGERGKRVREGAGEESFDSDASRDPTTGPTTSSTIRKGAKEEVQRLRDLLKNVSPAKVDNKKDLWRKKWTPGTDKELDGVGGFEVGVVLDETAEQDETAVADEEEGAKDETAVADEEEGAISPMLRQPRKRTTLQGDDAGGEASPRGGQRRTQLRSPDDLTSGSPGGAFPDSEVLWPGEGAVDSPHVGSPVVSVEEAANLDDNDWTHSPEIGPVISLKRGASAKALGTKASFSSQGKGPPAVLQRLGSNLFEKLASGGLNTGGNVAQNGAKPLKRQMSRTESLKKLVNKGLEHVESLQKGKTFVVPDNGSRAISDETKMTMARAIRNSQSVYSSTSLYCFVLTTVMFLSVFCFVFPAFKMMDLINMASTLSQASRRSFIVQSIVHLTREMVFDDGFSRLRSPQAAYAIQDYIGQLREADEAVRVGGKLGINRGADEHNPFHNKYMYQKGCPWRVNTTDCSVLGMPGVGGSGYYQLFTAFVDAVTILVTKYGPEPRDKLEEGTNWMGPAGNSNAYTNIVLPLDKVPLFTVENDRYLNFSQQAFSGDVNKGLSDIVDLLRAETLRILNSALNFNKYLYSVHVIVVFVGFYWLLFRRTIYLAIQEVHHARNFVVRMPVHILPQRDVELLVDYFRNTEDQDNADDDDIMPMEAPDKGSSGCQEAAPTPRSIQRGRKHSLTKSQSDRSGQS